MFTVHQLCAWLASQLTELAQSDEVLFLPPIVDAAESSPAAAAECARVLRKFLGKDYSSKPSWQYNAIMLIRILVDNPGETFTRNLDDKFVDTVRALLKNVKDRSVWRILLETLDDFECTKMHDQNLAPLILMWKMEKEVALRKRGVGPPIVSLSHHTLLVLTPAGPSPAADSAETRHDHDDEPSTAEPAFSKLFFQVTYKYPPARPNRTRLETGGGAHVSQTPGTGRYEHPSR